MNSRKYTILGSSQMMSYQGQLVKHKVMRTKKRITVGEPYSKNYAININLTKTT